MRKPYFGKNAKIGFIYSLNAYPDLTRIGVQLVEKGHRKVAFFSS